MLKKTFLWSRKHLEASLLPIEGQWLKKSAGLIYQMCKFCLSLNATLLTAPFSLLQSRLSKQNVRASALMDFYRDPKWNEQLMEAAPVEIGFATSDFQDNGPGRHPNTNWQQHYARNSETIGSLGKMPDMWNNPDQVIERLCELGVKKFRFSVGRDKVEPELGQPYDQEALQHYRHFCRKLKAKGIEPMVTLYHFNDPLYFSWERLEDVEGFVRYAEAVSEVLYAEGVRKIITINEPTIVVFQGWVQGAFPPHRKGDFKGAGLALKHMMLAHDLVYEVLKQRHPDFEIGIAHNPLRFEYYHKWNPLYSPAERVVCHYLTEIYHGAFMRFFKTGIFTLNIPFLTKQSFTRPKRPHLDFIGLQYYTDPLIKLSMTGAKSASRIPEEKLTSYDYRTFPEGLASALEELRALNVPIELTEIGIDTGINTDSNDQARILYFDKIFQVIQKAIDDGVPVRALYFWTLIDNLEWLKAWSVRFGFYSFDPATGKVTPRSVCAWLKNCVAKRRSLVNDLGVIPTGNREQNHKDQQANAEIER